MRMAVIENDRLRVVVALDRGAEIVEFGGQGNGGVRVDPLLRLPDRLRPAGDATRAGADGDMGFMDRYAGGWQEILPNGGSPSEHAGVRYGQHGDIALVPWSFDVLVDRADEATVACTGRSAAAPLAIERRMTLRSDRPVLLIEETLTNESDGPVDAMWGHHVAFGRPFLEDGGRIHTSGRTVTVHDPFPGDQVRRLIPGAAGTWPVVAGPTGPIDLSVVPAPGVEHAMEMCYLSEFDGPAWYAISGRSAGFALRWDGDLFRYLWLWQELESGGGYPGWGSLYAVALEPWTSFPTNGLAAAVQRGTQLVVPARGEIHTTLVAALFDPAGPVELVDADGTIRFREGETAPATV
jgi:hypothetical protein